MQEIRSLFAIFEFPEIATSRPKHQMGADLHICKNTCDVSLLITQTRTMCLLWIETNGKTQKHKM